MFCFKDKTFCSNPDCTCGRKMTKSEEDELVYANRPDGWDGLLPVSYRDFCGGNKDWSNEKVS